MHDVIYYAKMSFLLLNDNNIIIILINLSLNTILKFVIKLF